MTYLDAQRGQLTLYVLVFSSVAILILSGLVIWADSSLRIAYRTVDQVQAFQIAEAGLEYYRWHLAHAPNDYQDGTGHAGPYVHSYKDNNGVVIGQFSLDITTPPNGSSLTTITSTGTLGSNPSITKTLRAQLAKSSVIQYAVLSNNNIRFEADTQVYGPAHSNGGVRFDGVSHDLVTSARSTYDDPNHSGAYEYAVHTHTAPTDPLPPTTLPVRNDVFVGGRKFPVPLVSFSGITAGLATIKSNAQSGGKYFAKSGAKGYHIVLKTNDTYDIYKVKKLKKAPSGCENSQHQKGWATWSIDTSNGSEQLVGNYAFPANGIIFVEDNLWIEGQISTANLTVAAGKLPSRSGSYKNIIVNKSLTYTYYDGRDALGLIAQGNVSVGMVSDTTIRIDGAIVAQNGRVGRYYYKPASESKNRCSPYDTRTSLTLFGMTATYKGYGFAYTDGTGYQSRSITFDAHLQYNPPPSFPLVSGEYQQIQWSEQ